jgi:DNA-binding NarL/FixJ family response regulator
MRGSSYVLDVPIPHVPLVVDDALQALARGLAELQEQLDQARDTRTSAAVQEQAVACARELRVLEDGFRRIAQVRQPLDHGGAEYLTPRQRDVATGIAEGLSNEELADRLGITPGTAANHVEHILGRLRFKSRSQIAVWAVERGLYRSGQEPAGATSSAQQ